MKIMKHPSKITACCSSCNGSGYTGGVDGFVKVVKMPRFALFIRRNRQKVA